MKALLNLFVLLAVLAAFTSCGKDDDNDPAGTKPDISFRTTPPYISQDISLPGGTLVVIGVNAAPTTVGDSLTHYTITESINGGAATTVHDAAISESQALDFFNTFTRTLGDTNGETHKYTFKVTTNKGVSNEISLTVTIVS